MALPLEALALLCLGEKLTWVLCSWCIVISMVVMFATHTSTQNKQVEGDGCSSDDDDDGVKHTKCGKDGVMATHQVRVCLYFLLFADSHACCNFMACAA